LKTLSVFRVDLLNEFGVKAVLNVPRVSLQLLRPLFDYAVQRHADERIEIRFVWNVFLPESLQRLGNRNVDLDINSGRWI
jgi:hypothetical protein